MREAAAEGATPTERLERMSRWYFEHWTQHQDYFQIFWAVENQTIIGDLPSEVLFEITEKHLNTGLRGFPVGENAARVGRVTEKGDGLVTLTSDIGSERILDMLSGEQLPRIC